MTYDGEKDQSQIGTKENQEKSRKSLILFGYLSFECHSSFHCGCYNATNNGTIKTVKLYDLVYKYT